MLACTGVQARIPQSKHQFFSNKLRKTKKHVYQEAMEYDEDMDEPLPKEQPVDWDILHDEDGCLAGNLTISVPAFPSPTHEPHTPRPQDGHLNLM